MNIKINGNSIKTADVQFIQGNQKVRKRWQVPVKVYQHLKESLHEEVCKKWAAQKVVKLLTQDSDTKELLTEAIESTVDKRTVSDCFGQFLEQVEELGTRDRYETDYQNYILLHVGGLPVASAAQEKEINRLRSNLQKQQSKRSKVDKCLSSSTINGALNTLRAFFDWAKIEGLLSEKPTVKRVKQLKATKLAKNKCYTIVQQELILNIAYDKSPMIYAAFVCGLDLGLRIGEAVGLKWEHITWQKIIDDKVLPGEVEISETIKISKATKKEVIRLPKNKTPDVVHMSERCKLALLAIKPEGAKGRIFQRVRFSHRSKFKPGNISVNVLGNWVEMILTLANKVDPEILITRNYHKFRHSLGTNLADKEVYITKIQDHLRHKAISSTMHYLHSDSREAIVEAMESIGQSANNPRNSKILRLIKSSR